MGQNAGMADEYSERFSAFSGVGEDDGVASVSALLAEARRLRDSGQALAACEAAQRAAEAAETRLAAAQRRFRSMINAVPDAVTVLAQDGRIVDANTAACRSFRLSHDELLGLSVYDLNPSLPKDRIRTVIAEHAVGESFVHETVNQRADGSEFPVEVHSSVFVSGREAQIMAVARDVTHRIEAERELRASEARYRQLLQAMDKGVLIHDATGRILSYNPSACRIAGMDGETLIATMEDRSRWDLLDGSGAVIGHDQVPHLRALREGRTVASTTVGVYLRDQSRHIWLDVTSTPLFREGDDRAFQAISTFSDISELTRDRELFRQTQMLARIGGWDWDPVQGGMYWTETLYRVLEVPAGETVGLATILRTLRPRERAQVELAFHDAGSQGTGFDLECRIGTRSGARLWVRLIGGARYRDGQVFRVCGTLQDITREKLAADELQVRALTDSLTGLPNRDALTAQLADALDQSRLDSPPSLLHADLDRFKVVNDLLGHLGGDRILRLAGDRLKTAVGGHGTVARFGADEFLVLLPAGGKLLAREVADRVVHAFSRPFAIERQEFTITTSIGMASYPDDGTTVQQLLQSADVALQEAKRRGRGAWQAFDPALADKLSQRLLMETQLRRALENDEFHLVYQPQVDLRSGKLRAVEALIRWRNPKLGAVPPAEFIPYAETTGDIVRIGSWVVREACRQLARWRAEGVDVERIAVNVSVRQLMNEDFDSVVGAALQQNGLPASALEVEITERVVMDEAPEALRTLRALKARGVTITIDDFGEGYSAMSYLRRLPLDCLKISLTFMRGIPANPADVAVCRSILLIARSLGLQVIGEGVEETEQRRFLIEHGADLAQGYHFAPPLSPEDVARYLPPSMEPG